MAEKWPDELDLRRAVSGISRRVHPMPWPECPESLSQKLLLHFQTYPDLLPVFKSLYLSFLSHASRASLKGLTECPLIALGTISQGQNSSDFFLGS
jgi:hypothetical protein